MSNLKRIAIVGGGLMGAGIAQVFATAGHRVRLFEPAPTTRASVTKRIAGLLQSYGLNDAALSNIEVDADLETCVGEADFVTEAAPERLELKREMFAQLVQVAHADAILASNTSVIPIHRIAAGLPSAHRIVGTHWWNPAGLIPLVEVVQSTHTSTATIKTTLALLSSIGKAPAHITKDLPGFVGNRLQHALWREAIAMLAEGVCDAATLDHCVKNSFGLRLPVLGPLENADLVGLDLTLDIHRIMLPELDRSDRPSPYLEAQVAAGRLGFKSGAGFRDWTPQQMEDLRCQLAEHLLKARSPSAR